MTAMRGAPNLVAWKREPAARPEERCRPGSPTGYLSWNCKSPEVEVCEFIAALVRLLRPSVVIETGVGQGYVTRRVVRVLEGIPGASLVAYEGDDAWREALRAVWLWKRHMLADHPTPTAAEIGEAGLVVFDSDIRFRAAEIHLWHRHGKTGSVAVVHDVDPDRADGREHLAYADLLRELNVPGLFVPTPRGVFVGQR